MKIALANSDPSIDKQAVVGSNFAPAELVNRSTQNCQLLRSKCPGTSSAVVCPPKIKAIPPGEIILQAS